MHTLRLRLEPLSSTPGLGRTRRSEDRSKARSALASQLRPQHPRRRRAYNPRLRGRGGQEKWLVAVGHPQTIPERPWLPTLECWSLRENAPVCLAAEAEPGLTLDNMCHLVEARQRCVFS